MSLSFPKPSFAILSACKNEQDYVAKCIDSVLKQSLLPSLWVIIDDGSTIPPPDNIFEHNLKIQIGLFVILRLTYNLDLQMLHQMDKLLLQ